MRQPNIIQMLDQSLQAPENSLHVFDHSQLEQKHQDVTPAYIAAEALSKLIPDLK
jgi:hypothetical protein